MRSKILAVLAPAALLVAACENSTNTPSTGQLTVQLTDAPSDMIASATAYISTVYVIRSGDSLTGPRDTISSTPQSYDLLSLAGGITALLGSATINTGNISQLRLVVDSATVTLKDSLFFSDGTNTKTLKIPSGMQSGIKVVFSEPLVVEPGQNVVVVDFDVSRSFVFTGLVSQPNGVIFKPVLHGAIVDESGSISGTVTPASSHAALFAIQGTDTVRTAFADTLSGVYTLTFLPAGTYTVSAQGIGGPMGVKTVILPAAKDTTGINFP